MSKDYFGTLATVVQLAADAVESRDERARKRSVATLKEVSEDLIYLQEHATIALKR